MKNKPKTYDVFDSLGNWMQTFYHKKDALTYKAVFGNSGWDIVEH